MKRDAPKMMYFSQLPIVKKDIILGRHLFMFGPSYFVRALTQLTLHSGINVGVRLLIFEKF